MSPSEIATLIKDVILGGAAIVGAVVAIKGLSTWRRQLKGQSEYDLSRRILVSLFRYRDAINGVRHPAMWTYEMPAPPEEEASRMTREQIRFYGTSKGYQTRWDKVQAQRSNLYADLLEAEAFWGKQPSILFKVLFDLEHELLMQVQNHLQMINPDTEAEYKEALRRISEKKRDILYDDLSEEGDDYKNEFIVGVEAIEKYLKPKLTHN